MGRGFLDGLTYDDVDALLDLSTVVHAGRGQTLLHAGRAEVVILLRGAAMVVAATGHGRGTVTSLLGPGTAWGMADAIGPHVRRAEVTALEDSCGLTIPGGPLRRLVTDRPAVAWAVLDVVVSGLDADEFSTRAAPRGVSRLRDLPEFRVLERIVQQRG